MHKTWLERKLAGAEWFTAFLKRHPSLSIRKTQAIYDIPGILSLAFPHAASNIIAGFKVAGISPFDRDIFQEADFAATFTTDRPMALSVSPTNQSDTNPEVSNGISSGSNDCVLTPQRIISERPDLVNELPCIVAPPGLLLPLGLCSTSYASWHISPENVLPFSKAAPSKKAASNRTRISSIFTDSPVMAALANKKRKGSIDTRGRGKVRAIKQTTTQTRGIRKGTEETTTQTRGRGKGSENTTGTFHLDV